MTAQERSDIRAHDERREIREGEVALAQVARTANRAVYYRTLALVAVLVLGGLGWYAFHLSEKIDTTEDPCSMQLHGGVCEVRTCERLRDAGYALSAECAAVLNEVRKGRIGEGPGAQRPRHRGGVQLQPAGGPTGSGTGSGSSNGNSTGGTGGSIGGGNTGGGSTGTRGNGGSSGSGTSGSGTPGTGTSGGDAVKGAACTLLPQGCGVVQGLPKLGL